MTSTQQADQLRDLTPAYPNSNIQLFEALRTAGWSAEALSRAAAGYDLALRYFSARYRGDGRPFIEHLVRTAGILQRHGAAEAVVLAGLTHAYYSQGDFGLGSAGVKADNQAKLRKAIGHEAETLVAAYSAFPWSATSIAVAIERLESGQTSSDIQERHLLTIRICNELEESLDRALLYLAASKRRTTLNELRLSATLARRLGMDALSTHVDEVLMDYATLDDDLVSSNVSGREESYVLLPPSASKRLRVRLGGLKGRVHRALRSNIRSA